MAKKDKPGLTTDSIGPNIKEEPEAEAEEPAVEPAPAVAASELVESEVKQPALVESPKRPVRLRVPGLVGKFHGAYFNDEGESEEPVSLKVAALLRAQFKDVAEIK